MPSRFKGKSFGSLAMLRTLFLVSLATALGSQEAPERPIARVGVGAFTDGYSDGTGTWKGWTLNGEWFRDEQGPWSFSAVGTQRPEGTGTLFTLGKDHAFGESSWVWGSLGVGTGADFVPTFRGDLDVNLGISGSWSMGLGGAWSRFRDGSSTTLLQAGPAWMGEAWSVSSRIQQLRYSPGRTVDTGYVADVRWGTSNLLRWHSVRMAWGQGIIDSLQSGSGFGSGGPSGGLGMGSGTVGGSGGLHRSGSMGPTLNEFLISTSSHIPITGSLAIRTDVAWGQRETQFRMWSFSFQTLFTF